MDGILPLLNLKITNLAAACNRFSSLDAID
jgi:hypothetical protein